jgi:uncharacterized protein with HEPN domain
MVRDEAVLFDIVRAAKLALEFRQDMDKSSFFDDLKTQSAILHQLTVIGEAVKRLSTEFVLSIRRFLGLLLQGCAINSFTAMTW